MTFQPALPFGGFAGWQFLNRTLEKQQANFNRSAVVQRDTDYFRERIGQIETAEQLVNDRRLLRVALGAFGLDADLPNRFFIRKVLEEGAADPKSLGNRLGNKRYLEMSRAFGFGDLDTPNTKLSDFADRILPDYKGRQFEIAVGNQDQNLRLALNLRRDLADLAGSDRSERAKWFAVMGQPPLRQVFETVFNLPQGFGALDLDRQLTILQDRTRRSFGDAGVSQFSDPAKIEELARQFLLRSELQNANIGGFTRGAAALQLLQGATAPGLRLF
ncbi:MAG: DUF1217 domain-containing protein [Alkalilacustris sp.]